MKDFPALVPQEFRLEGRGHLEAAADIKLSSAGKHVINTRSIPLSIHKNILIYIQ